MAAAEHTPEDEEHIFQQAAALPLPERIAYLDFACEGQPTLRADVERLIAGSQDPEFMERAVDRSATMQIHNVARFQPEEVGERIGPYTLLQRIGEGGFGVVWMAGQEKPVRRRVALKIIKLGMDTKEVVARFEQERQALAMMDHPNIARVIDAAATPLGRPYFAMELVSGVKITEYCDQANLPTVDRLRLFMSVCHAVQHAHQKGIIHRDLKPSNILVTLHDGVPVPKVIDFGVAKATQQRLTDLTLLTQFEQMIGTPLYMSPEQAEMSSVDIDTRSDIYSLGVLLYELLTGRTPFDPEHLIKAGFDEMRRVIREVVPEKPSTFVSTMALDVRAAVARHRSAEEAKFIGLIRGDLDWIVMKALEKDRNRRYDTAGALAKDIERHLRSEPVLARPASAGYRFRTFVRRNRAAFAATSGIAAAVLVGFAVSLWQALRAQREADRANSALADLRGSAPAFADQARGLVGRERFDEAIEKLDYALKLQPDSVEYLLTKADLLESQMRFSEAMPLYREAIRRGPVARRVTEHVQLCERMEREKAMRGKLSRESLAELFAKMDEEHRSAAELMQVGQLLGAERTLLLDYWMERLQALPIGPDKPLESRLKMRADGLLSLDLSGTRVEDLDALQGMPLGDLDCTGCEHLTDITSLREMHLRQLRLANTGVSDLVALSSVSQLEELDISGTKVTSLQPLLGIGIRSLKMAKVEVEDLSPLEPMPLEELEIEQTRVSDLSPLEKLPLKRLSADSIPAIDFRPISELPLEYCSIRRTRCYDLAFLQKMPLRELYLTGCFARNSLALAGIKTLEILALPELMRGHPEEGMTTLRKHARLRRIGFEAPEGPQPGLLPTAEEFWKTWDPVVERFREAGVKIEIKVLADQTWEASLDNQNVEDLSPLRGSPITKLYLRNTKITSLNAIAGMPLRALSVQGTKVSDLTPLSGMLLEELELNDTAVASLNPLRGMRIRSLGIEQTEIRDLSAVRGMPLEALWMGTTKVSDLSPLRGLPIRILHIDDCPFLSDLSPLLDIPTLEQVFLPTTAANVQVLRSLTHLQFISFDLNSQANRPLHTAEEFWSMKTPMKEEQLARGQHFDELRFLIRSRVEHHRSPELWKDYLKLVTLAMALGDLHDYDQLCSIIQRRPPGIDSGLILRAGCWHTTCGISTDAMREAFNDLKAGYGDPPKTGESGRIVYALCEYRLGLWEQASNRLLQAPPCTRAYTSAITATLLALAHTKMGDLQAGRLKLEEARVHSEEGWPTEKPATDVSKGVGSWYECLLAHLLFKEAEALIATAPGGAGQK